MVMVKICGVTREEDVNATVDAGADAIGFVVNVKESPRNLPLREARNLMEQLPNKVDSVAVTVASQLEKIVELYRELTPDSMQLHGATPTLAHQVRLATGAKIIVAVDPRSPYALNPKSHQTSIDALLVDTYGPRSLGGTGRTHDWNLSRKIRDAIHPLPMILAGGLTPENITYAVRMVRPYGVDVSTGVELQPGIKDAVKITQFVKKAKEAEA